MTLEHPAPQLVGTIADQLAHPEAFHATLTDDPWRTQSLAYGAPGVALLHIELAAADLRPWQRVHDWLRVATSSPITSGADSHLFYGAPALAHALACADAARPGSYGQALETLDASIATDVGRRIDAGHARIDRGGLPALAEFDGVRGLTGIGSHLLRRDPGGPAIHAILAYLVRLTDPVKADCELLPGWWTASGPSGRHDERFPDGHANTGMAHGIAGPLSLLALADIRGVTVDGQASAIKQICKWLDQWQTDTDAGPVWPYWVTRAEVRAGRLDWRGPQRPSWCYGTAGLARAQQLAALAIGDDDRRRQAENALVQALLDPGQRAATTDRSLCHGYAGFAHLAARVAADAHPTAAARLRALVPDLLDAIQPRVISAQSASASLLETPADDLGLLEGATGIALATLAATTTTGPRTTWDSCLLIA